jgi:hypothetical protein
MAFPIAGPTTVVDQSLADDRAGSFYPGRKMAGSSASRELRFVNLANDASARSIRKDLQILPLFTGASNCAMAS